MKVVETDNGYRFEESRHGNTETISVVVWVDRESETSKPNQIMSGLYWSQAARILNVSVEFIRRLVVDGKLKRHGVFTNMLDVESLVAHKKIDDLRREEAWAEYVRLSNEMYPDE